ncbi:MAG: protein-L-isoaspartate(D-aspartate) O-methyltransferase [Gemmatimonadetes bacterium]|nr:protein-L-isoaspartate(D-aspartate) O-methyltransferase [Gemmatimonadota bacterium]
MVAQPVADGFAGYRQQLVETLQAKGIRDLAVLQAIATVPRHRFVPEAVRHRAYEDSALPIAAGQTISQPWVQARSIQELRLTGKEKVLEVGAGSGYQTALLARVAGNVVAVERVPALATGARQALDELGVRNVAVVVGDGTLGWRSLAPFDAIIVAAASPDVPAPLVEQLKPGGRMVVPIGTMDEQALVRVEKLPDGTLETTPLSDVRFVPLLGQFGFRG